jgi:hypothetical protein
MDESHQATWKRVRPVLLVTAVPIVAAFGYLALATYAKKTANPADLPSMAAFDACLTANNLQPTGGGSQFDQQIASEQEMKACGSKIPSYVIAKWRAQAEAQQTAYRECVENLAGPGRGFGRFHGPPANFRAALAACRGLLQGGGGGGPPVAKKNAPGPVA